MLLSDLVSRRSVSFAPVYLIYGLGLWALCWFLSYVAIPMVNGTSGLTAGTRFESGVVLVATLAALASGVVVFAMFMARSQAGDLLAAGARSSAPADDASVATPCGIDPAMLGSISSVGLSMITRSPVARHRLPSFLRMGIVSVVFLKSSRYQEHGSGVYQTDIQEARHPQQERAYRSAVWVSCVVSYGSRYRDRVLRAADILLLDVQVEAREDRVKDRGLWARGGCMKTNVATTLEILSRRRAVPHA